jgi:hypothetical protein
MLTPSYINIVVLWPPNPYKDRSRPVANWLKPEPVKTGLVTAKDQSVVVQSGFLRFLKLGGPVMVTV